METASADSAVVSETASTRAEFQSTFSSETTHEQPVSVDHDQTVNSHDPEQTTEWSWSADLKGEGEAPEWFNSKTFNTIEDQAKAYPELQKMHSKRMGSFTGAPDGDYKFEMPEELAESGFEANLGDEFKEFSEIAREMNMSQEAFQQTMAKLATYEFNQQQSRNEALNSAIDEMQSAQLEEFGHANAEEFRQTVQMARNIPGLSDEGMNDLLDGLTTSEGLKAFQAIVKNSLNSEIPGRPAMAVDSEATLKQENWRVSKMNPGPARDAAQQALNNRYQRWIEAGK